MGVTNFDSVTLGDDLVVGGDSTMTGNLTVSGTITGNVDVSSTLKFGDGEDIVDTSGNELIEFGVTASAVNEIKVTNAATGGDPTIAAQGGDTNVAIAVKGKGTGAVKLGQATSVGVTLVADQPILDSSANELVKFTKVASAVNEITIGNNSTGLGPTLTASGETNVPVTLAGKGTGYVGLGQATSTDVRLVADQPIADSSGNELLKFSKTASAVNELTVANAATTGNVALSVTGDTAVSGITITGKAGGAVTVAGGVASLTGGAGNTSGAGGASSLTGGQGGATGVGGAASVTSGAGGSTSGASGGVTVASGTTTAGSGSATGMVQVGSGAGAASAVAVAGGASGDAILATGNGGANTGGASGQVGGAAGAASVIGGNGGATNSTGAHAGGAGGRADVIAGAGGNATAGTGNGGEGGSVVLEAGTGGTSAGGTAGVNGVVFARSPMLKTYTVTAMTDTTTITAAALIGGMIKATPTAAASYTMPTGAVLAAALPAAIGVGDTVEFTITNVATNATFDVTVLTAASGITLFGNMVVEANDATTTKGSSAVFRAVATGATAFDVYRIS